MKAKRLVSELLRKIVFKEWGNTTRLKTKDLNAKIDKLNAKTDFLIYEVQKNLERHRWEDFNKTGDKHLIEQTKDSFDYQWGELNTGKGLPSDKEFMANLKTLICTYLGGVNENFFVGKKIADVGCGMGRFTYGMLSMGANVTAMDQSQHALENVANLCNPWKDNLTTKRIDLLNMNSEDLAEQFDVVWCYGVAHHTGNTYLAMDNICKLVKPNGRVFMMLYGYPETDNYVRLSELANYDKLREITRNMSNKEKVDYLKNIFPEDLVHGYFDAISPHINDILSYEEIKHFMILEGFEDITRTFDSDNIHFIATKK